MPDFTRLPMADQSSPVSVVVPVYNSAQSLPHLVRRLCTVLSDRHGSFEVLLVNDGSDDDSAAVLDSLASSNPRVRVLHLSRNYGQHNATLCGIRAARFPTTVTIDDDLQNPPEEIPALLAALDGNVDVVYGRPAHERHGLWRDIASQVTKLALKTTMGARTAPFVSAFRAFRTPLRESFADYRGSFVSIDVLLTWGTTRFDAVVVRHDAREGGASNYSFRMLLTHAVNMMTGFSTIPLQVASVIGFALTLFGVGVLVWVIGRYFWQGGSVAGFPFLASIVAIFSGAQLFALGIIGEYLSRMHFRIMDKPSYVVRPTTGREGRAASER